MKERREKLEKRKKKGQKQGGIKTKLNLTEKICRVLAEKNINKKN